MQLAAAKAAVEDVSAEVRDFAEKIHASPERLAEIEDRLAALDRLKRKYGGAGASQTLAEVMRFGEDAARRLAEVENRDELLAELRVRQERGCGEVSRGGGEVDSGADGGGGAIGEAGDGGDQRPGDDGAVPGGGFGGKADSLRE